MKKAASNSKNTIMQNTLILFAFLLLSCGNPAETKKANPQTEVTTYYLIRHAEKDRSDSTNQDPELTDAGNERAQKWAEVLKDVNFDAVYSTNYKRTMQTAEPLAQQNKLEILQYDPGKLYEEDFRKATKAKTVLVVGHSNTTPQLANTILETEKYQNIDDNENGALFIVRVNHNGVATSQVLYIN